MQHAGSFGHKGLYDPSNCFFFLNPSLMNSPELTYIYSLQGSIACRAVDGDAGAARLKEFIERAGALAEELGFHVFYLRPSPTDDKEPGFSSRNE
jgi:hypothetical protein